MPAGIFGLKKTYKKQVLDAWPELSEFGYFAGGYSCLLYTSDAADE